MSVERIAIEEFAALMVGGDIFKDIKHAVGVMSTKDLTGSQKKAAILSDFEHVGEEIGSWALNLAIELAVAWFKKLAA